MVGIQDNIHTIFKSYTCIWIFTILIITLLVIQIDTGTRAQQTVISDNTTWTLANSPYIISGNVLVENGASLTIEPGVEVKFDGDYHIQIEGRLVAEGTENNMITFTSNAESPAPGDWRKIKIMGNADNGSSFKYCRIEYAYTAIALDNIIFYTAPNISNCIFENNYGGGIEYYVVGESTISSHKQITNNTILNINDGYGIHITSNVYSPNASLLVSNNLMKYNDGNVIAFFAPEGKVTFTNNILVKNDGPGIVGNGDNVNIKNNLIAFNEGSGISISGSEGNSYAIEHNTIVSNGRQDYDDAGIDLRQYDENANIIFRYNNLFNNTPYDARNNEEIDINISNNWWGTTESEIIDQHIHDYYDDFNRGKLNYTPFLTEPDPDAPDPSGIINEPPFTPTIPDGHTSCLVNSSYTYVTTAEDPEGNQIKYGWDWDGDGTVDEWSDFMESGHMDVKQHMWTISGTYNVKVKAVDEHGEESEWSEALEVEARIVYVESDTEDDNYSIIPIIFIVIVIIVVVIGIAYNIFKRK